MFSYSSPLKVLSSNSNVFSSGDAMRSLLLAALFVLLDMLWELISYMCKMDKMLTDTQSQLKSISQASSKFSYAYRDNAPPGISHPELRRPRRLFRY